MAEQDAVLQWGNPELIWAFEPVVVEPPPPFGVPAFIVQLNPQPALKLDQIVRRQRSP